MTIRANCKINIGLDVLRRRADGYHDLSTVIYPITELFDEVSVEPIEGEDVEFISEGLIIDCPSDKNLCVRAAKLMQQLYATSGVRITLNKMVPFGAGLGGGSSDATAVMLAMNSIFELSLDEETLISVAAMIGSDTPFFVRNTPQLCLGRGEIMSPIDLDLSPYEILLVKPPVGISTAVAYGGVKPAIPAIPLQKKLCQPISEWQSCVKNSFEHHIFELYPTLREIKERLLGAGALYASMSGSGSTMYGIFERGSNFNDIKASFSDILIN